MAARVLHFGTDTCNRLLVLRSVGYSADTCTSVVEFHSALELSDPDAVLVGSRRKVERLQVVTLTREHSRARLILFDNAYGGLDEGEFDLVIPPLMHPEEWLRKVAEAIEQSRALNARSTAIRERSAQLVKGSKTVRLASMSERERTVQERTKAQKVLDDIGRKRDGLEQK